MTGFSTPTAQQVKEALRRIPTFQHRRVFYDALANPNWVRPLHEAGAFVAPGEPRVDDKGLVRETPWPEMDYLVRVAKDAPKDVVDVLLELRDSSNSWVRRGVFAIGAVLPPDEAARLKPLVEAWRDQLGFRTDPVTLAAMTRNLLDGGHTKLGRTMANILFRPRPTGQEHGKPLTGIDEYWYEQELPGVADSLGDSALTVLTPWLEEWERLEGRFTDKIDFTSFNRSTIASREDGYANVEQSLVDVIRDVAAKNFAQSPKNTAEHLVARPMILLRKIALYALTRTIESLPETVEADEFVDAAKILLTDHISADHACRVEFADLYIALHDRGIDLDQLLTDIVAAGPYGSADRLRDRLSRRATGSDLDKEVQEYTDNWQQRLLATVGADHLPEALAARLADLEKRNGQIANPRESDFKVTSWTGPTSPVSQEQLAAMKPEELTNYLETWHAGDAWMGPSHEGVARELTEVVTKNSAAFEGQPELVVRLRPTYLRAIISGWDAAYRADASLDWTSVIALLGDVIRHPNETDIPVEGEQFDDDPDFTNAKQSAVSLLADMSRGNDQHKVPNDVLQVAADLLTESLSDAGPWTRYNEREVSDDLDPLTISINWQWPIAVRGVLNLTSHGPETSWFGQSRQALEVELGRQDKIGATHAVVGEGLGRLFNGAPAWLELHRDELFGTQDASSRNQQIALTTALAVHNVHPKLIEFLRDPMIGAMHLGGPIASGWKSHQKGLNLIGHWIVVGLIWDVIKSDDPLATTFFGSVDPEIRGDVVGHIAWSFLNSPVDPDIRVRLEQLWDARVAHVREHPKDTAELKDFYWFIRSEKFDPEWWLPRLREAAELHPNLNTHGMIGEQLAKVAPQMPRDALEATRLLMDRVDETGILGYDLSEHAVPQVIAAALDSGDDALAKEASKFMNDLGSRGYVNLEDRVNQVRLV